MCKGEMEKLWGVSKRLTGSVSIVDFIINSSSLCCKTTQIVAYICSLSLAHVVLNEIWEHKNVRLLLFISQQNSTFLWIKHSTFMSMELFLTGKGTWMNSFYFYSYIAFNLKG